VVEILAGLLEAVFRIWDFVTRDRPPSREAAGRTIEEVNSANARLRVHGMRSQPK
jgi:hypothetical protein